MGNFKVRKLHCRPGPARTVSKNWGSRAN